MVLTLDDETAADLRSGRMCPRSDNGSVALS